MSWHFIVLPIVLIFALFMVVVSSLDSAEREREKNCRDRGGVYLEKVCVKKSSIIV